MQLTTVIAILSTVAGVTSLPADDSTTSASIFKRTIYHDSVIDASCDAAQKEHLKKALQDMVTLASGALDVVKSRNPKAETYLGYSHYFSAADGDLVVKGAYETLKAGGFDFTIKCLKKDHPDCAQGEFAQTARWLKSEKHPTDGPGDFVGMCPKFFTDATTKRELPDLSKPAEIAEWCKPDSKNSLLKWETGGHTLLHEFTHLSSFGQKAGVLERVDCTDPNHNNWPYTSYSTCDYPGGNTSQKKARELKNKHAKNLKPTDPARIEIAESYAACASELFVQKVCGVKDVNPSN